MKSTWDPIGVSLYFAGGFFLTYGWTQDINKAYFALGCVAAFLVAQRILIRVISNAIETRKRRGF